MLFVRQFNITIEAAQTLETSANIQYLHTLIRVEALCQFDLMFVDVEITNPLTVEAFFFELGAYFSLLICYWKNIA